PRFKNEPLFCNKHVVSNLTLYFAVWNYRIVSIISEAATKDCCSRRNNTMLWLYRPNQSNESTPEAPRGMLGAPLTSLVLDFTDAQVKHLVSALEAPICEFVCGRYSCSSSSLSHYSHTYPIRGFTGGYWAYATNTDETAGLPCSAPTEETVPKSQRRLAVYYLGWDSIELHEDGTQTEAFAEEISKLQPYYGPGSGAWYAMLRQNK
ncbi:hypothetical protein CCMA1212_007542, partial [Trichoderma ghanense]